MGLGQYLTFNDGARLITGSQELPGWKVEDDRIGVLTTGPLDMGSPKT